MSDGPARRGRGHRRATGGTPPSDGTSPQAVPGAAVQHAAARDPFAVSRDDTDEGWGGPRDGGDDERILREVPPHW